MTGHGWTAAPNAVLRAGGSRTTNWAESGCSRRTTLQGLAQTADSSRLRKGITANTVILICWLILLIVTLVALELHIRSLSRHSSLFLAQPQIRSTAFGDGRGTACSCLGFGASPRTDFRLKSDTASVRPNPVGGTTCRSAIAASIG
jgi:hypothetical protein